MIWVRPACVLCPCGNLVRGRLEEAAARILAVRARSGRKGVSLIRETSHRIEMLSISPRVKKILFTVLWVLQAAACFGIPAFGKLPYVLAGFILLLLVLLWVFPGNVALRRIIIDVFILLSLAFLAMFILLALFFGNHHNLLCFALLGVDILIILASCWLIKP